MIRARWRAAPYAFLALSFLGATYPVRADDPGPQNTLRRFSAADAMGARTGGPWHEVAELVAWPLEPAWDRVVFITGYRIGSPETLEDGRVSISVDYAVVGEASAVGFETAPHLERVDFLLASAEGADWRIVSPALPPHVFGHRLQADDVVASLKHGRGTFVPNSLFVQQLLQAAGWDVPLVPTNTLLDEGVYGSVSSPRKGDLVVYVQAGVPYHVGFLEARDRVVSSTLNAGIMRTTPNAFMGEIHYLRLRARTAVPSEAPVATPTEVLNP
jgi:hypothetical protein